MDSYTGFGDLMIISKHAAWQICITIPFSGQHLIKYIVIDILTLFAPIEPSISEDESSQILCTQRKQYFCTGTHLIDYLISIK